MTDCITDEDLAFRHEWPTDHRDPPLCKRCGTSLIHDVGFCRGAISLLLAEARTLRATLEYVLLETRGTHESTEYAAELLKGLHEPFYRSSSDAPVAAGGTHRWQVPDESSE